MKAGDEEPKAGEGDPKEETVKDNKKNKEVTPRPETKKMKETAEGEKPGTSTWRDSMLRIIDVPVEAADLSNLVCAKENEILYPKSEAGKRTMHKYSLEDRKDEEVAELDFFLVSADGKKMLYSNGPVWGICDAGAKPIPGEGVINTRDISVKIDPAGRMARDLRRGVAGKPRLLLRSGHARVRLARHEGRSIHSFCPIYRAVPT